MQDLSTTLIQGLEEYGLKAVFTPVEHIREIEDEILGLKENSLLDEEFYNRNLSWMDFNCEDTMPNAKSILVIACPQYLSRISFKHNKKEYIVSLPPTYVYSDLLKKVNSILTRFLAPQNYSFERTKLPAKLLAVRTGLGMYGRNNICYVNGMGSFLRLFTFYTDMPCSIDSWREKAVMPDCGSCCACVKVCLAKCIDSERFLIHAERCITRFNEDEGDFPGWIDEKWHSSIVGCMKCQLVCPKNREFISKCESEVSFKPEEIGMILDDMPLTKLPGDLRRKLDSLDLTEYYSVLKRNISVLIK